MESHSTYHSNNCTLYPGEYIPMLDAEEVKAELKKIRKKNIGKPEVNVTEHKDHFRLEVAIPGLNREDFFITIENNTLSITVLHKRVEILTQGYPRLQEFSYDCFSRHVILPEFVETEFVRAEYREGILSIYLPKSLTPSPHYATRVIVY